MFYINKDKYSFLNVFRCLNKMFEPKYKDITWYCHNSGRYDAKILLPVLYKYNNLVKDINKQINDFNHLVGIHNEEVFNYNNLYYNLSDVSKANQKNFNNFDFTNKKDIINYNNIVYKFKQNQSSTKDDSSLLEMLSTLDLNNSILFEIKTVFRKKDILKIQISKKVNKTKYTITICDSCAIFPSSLKDLALKYKVDTQKGDFPHRFVNEDTLFYKGNTPDISYYDLNLEDYKNYTIQSEILN